MKHVRLENGKTALMDSNGLIQLDGPKDFWRAGRTALSDHPECFGWHHTTMKWEEIND